MIQIIAVQGDVLVDDRKRRYMEMAQAGMTLAPMGSYLIATTHTSRASITVNGKLIKLEPSSYVRILGDRTWWQRHTEFLSGRNVKVFLGRIWAKIAHDSPELGPNAVVGVRG